MTNKIKIIFPFIFIFSLCGLLYHELFSAQNNELPSALLGETVPRFKLPDLLSKQLFTQNDLRGHVSLINIWATWCPACVAEHDMLMQIKDIVPIYSINYKDNFESATRFLRNKGNPYRLIGQDIKGDVAIDFGVYGTPETFVINPEGKIIYRQVGAINPYIWNAVLYPLIKPYL